MTEVADAVRDEDLTALGRTLTGETDEAGGPTVETPGSGSAGPGRQPGVSVRVTAAVALLATGAAGWTAAGVFAGSLPRLVAAVGAAVGVGVVALAGPRRTGAHWLALVAATGAGAAFVAPAASGGSANLPGLVVEAVRSGGIGSPPVSFDPGWRFVLLVLVALQGAAALSLALSLARPRVAVALPLPLLVGATLLQPPSAGLASSVVPLTLVIAGLTLAYRSELPAEGSASRRFEVRRVARGLAIIVATVAGLTVITKAGFLFPQQHQDQVIPPQRPPHSKLESDRVLFGVESPTPGPWRMGVLDVYNGQAWLTPPFDPKRLRTVPRGGNVRPAPAGGGRETTTFTLGDIGGHQLPVTGDPLQVQASGLDLQYDPRTQSLRLPHGRASSGMRYAVTTSAAPSGVQLAQAPAPPASMAPFLQVPPPPDQVKTLLDRAPATDLWDRLQFVRNAFYQRVVASGAGTPVDVPPARVVQLLEGRPGTPYEITAAEVLLARWVGVPARFGYGFFGGVRTDHGWEVHPRDGRTWLEVYFQGSGWLPIVGTPPRAQPNAGNAPKQTNPAVRPSPDLAIVLYQPVRLSAFQVLFEEVRYWVVRALAVLLLAGLCALLYPGLRKVARVWRRRHWAQSQGPQTRIAVAYAELRDAARDLGLRGSTMTPIEFLDVIEDDGEHRELAWLVTRTLWGDLARDVSPSDAEAAETLARSVTRRLRRAQAQSGRVGAFISRLSLRDPYTRSIPDGLLWADGPAEKHQPHHRRLVTAGIVAILLGASAAAWAALPDTGPPARAERIPERIAPAEVGGVTMNPEPDLAAKLLARSRSSLVADARVLTMSANRAVIGYLQIISFRAGQAAHTSNARRQILRDVATGNFQLARVGGARAYSAATAEQLMWATFDPTGGVFELFVLRADYQQAESLVGTLLAYQSGEPLELAQQQPLQPVDPRRGEDL